MILDDCRDFTQEDFGEAVGISQQAVSNLVARSVLTPGQPMSAWIRSYAENLRSQAARRDPEASLPLERARLSKSQRLGQDIRNQHALAAYAPRSLLTDVLCLASAGVTDGLDGLAERVFSAWPDLPDAARETITRAIASARAEWVRATTDLATAAAVDGAAEDDELQQLATVVDDEEQGDDEEPPHQPNGDGDLEP